MAATFDLLNFVNWLDQNVGKGRKARDAQRDLQIAEAADAKSQLAFGAQNRQAMSDALSKFMAHQGDVASFAQTNPREAAFLPMINNFLQGQATIGATRAGTEATQAGTRRTNYLLPREAAQMDATRRATEAGTDLTRTQSSGLSYDIGRRQIEGQREDSDAIRRKAGGLPLSREGASIEYPFTALTQQGEQAKANNLVNLFGSPGNFSMTGQQPLGMDAVLKALDFDIPTNPQGGGGVQPGRPGQAEALAALHEAMGVTRGGSGAARDQGSMVAGPAPSPMIQGDLRSVAAGNTAPQGRPQVTHSIDMSQIYGASDALKKFLEGTSGKKLNQTSIPSSPLAYFMTPSSGLRGQGQTLQQIPDLLSAGKNAFGLDPAQFTPERIQELRQLIASMLAAEQGNYTTNYTR
jgi:hypothetical protein